MIVDRIVGSMSAALFRILLMLDCSYFETFLLTKFICKKCLVNGSILLIGLEATTIEYYADIQGEYF